MTIKQDYKTNIWAKSMLWLWAILALAASAYGQGARAGNRNGVPYRSFYQRMDAGKAHILELRGGYLFASGNNSKGQLGKGDTISLSVLNQVGTDGDWLLVSAGAEHSLAIKGDGSLWAWGNNTFGELGTQDTLQRTSPVQIGSEHGWRSIAAGHGFSLAIKNDGTLWAWGKNDKGQLGNGNTTLTAGHTLERIGSDNDWVSIAAGGEHVLALRSDGTLWAWGANEEGQIGNGAISTMPVNAPQQIGTGHQWKHISAGRDFSIAVRAQGTLWSWGANGSGQCGNGGTLAVPAPQQIGSENTWAMAAAGGGHGVAIKTNGSLWVWGGNESGQLGIGNTTDQLQPVVLSNTVSIVSCVAGNRFSLFLNAQGALSGMGESSDGQLGNGPNGIVSLPVTISAHEEFVSLEASRSGFNTFALKSNGQLLAWGANNNGQIGDGTQTMRDAPILVNGANEYIAVAPGGWHTLAIKADGTLWAWGNNSGGELGNGSFVSAQAPLQIGTDNDWAQVSANIGHSAGIKSDGTLWTWGTNYNGNLGHGTTSPSNVPIQVGQGNDWAHVSLGGSHAIAIKSDGTLWGWGRNYSGEAGAGTNTNDVLAPQQISPDRDWFFVVAQSMISMAMKANGTLWAWGSNSMKQINNGTAIKYTEPVEIGNGGWLYMAPGNFTTSALHENGTVFSWGNLGLFGEMGLGHNNPSLTATMAIGLGDAISLTGGQAHRGVLKANKSTICMVGRNYDGELGNGGAANTLNEYQCGITLSPPLIPITDSVVVSTVNQAAPIININGGNLPMQAVVYPLTSNPTVTWSIINVTGMAQISNSGIVTALGNGSVWAKAVSNQSPSMADSLEITISGQYSVDSIKVRTVNQMPAAIMISGGTLALEAEVYPSIASQAVDWSIINLTGSAYINANGMVTALSNGTIWAKAISQEDPGKMDSLLIEISGQDGDIDSVRVHTAHNAPAVISGPGQTLQLEAIVFPGSAPQNVTWQLIGNTTIASISPTGTVTGLAEGSVWAKAASVTEPDKSDSLQITIHDRPSRISDLGKGKSIVYPNPAKDFITIKTAVGGPANIYILDAQGRLMAHVYAGGNTKQTDIPVAQWPNGAYWIRIEGRDGTEVQKVIKE